MPKGGDLHNHLAGDPYAENLLKYGLNDPVCIDNNENVTSQIPNCIKPADVLKNKKMFVVISRYVNVNYPTLTILKSERYF